MNINEEKIINGIIQKVENNNREVLDFVCYTLAKLFCNCLYENTTKLCIYRHGKELLNYDHEDIIVETRFSIFEKILEYYNKISNEKSCLPSTVSENYANDLKLKEQYETLEDYVLALYRNNSGLFNEDEWQNSDFLKMYEKSNSSSKSVDYEIAKRNVTLLTIRKLISDRGRFFKEILINRLKEVYINVDDDFWSYSFDLQRYLDDVYYSTNESTLSNEIDKNLIKKI